MKIIGHTPTGDCIVVMSQADYSGLMSAESTTLNGTQLKMKRKQRGLTLADVGEHTGVSVSFLSDIERGKANPSMRTYEALVGFYSGERP